jgi:hypothetical protein
LGGSKLSCSIFKPGAQPGFFNGHPPATAGFRFTSLAAGVKRNSFDLNKKVVWLPKRTGAKLCFAGCQHGLGAKLIDVR